MKKYAVLTAAVLMQTCLGGIYAWSTFVPQLHSKYGLSSAQTGLIFGLCIAMLPVAMILAGRAEAGCGPRPVAAVGALLYAGGYLLAGASRGAFPLLLLGIGVIAGAGIGTAYICPLATCVKWFPERKGLITGLAVAGYGAGAIVLSALAAALFARGWDVLHIFRLVGIAYGAVVLLCAVVLSVPEGRLPEAPRAERFPSLAGQREFWGLAAGIFCGTFAGTVVIGNLKPLGLHDGFSPALATAAISVLAVGNATGRLTWGGVYDRWGARVLPVSLVFLGAAVLGMLGLSGVAVSFLALALLVGCGYGAALVVYAAQAAQVWGPGRLGRVYPFVMLFHGAGALVGPALAGQILDRTGSFAPTLLMGGAVALIGAVVVALVGLTDHARGGRMEVEAEVVI